MLTKSQLKAFVNKRNESHYDSNLQFQVDANASGFSVDDLGKAQAFTIDGFRGYQWKVPTKDAGTVRMVEFGRRVYLDFDQASGHAATLAMFEAMNTASFIAEEQAA